MINQSYTQDLPTEPGEYIRVHQGVKMIIDLVEQGGAIGFTWGGKFIPIKDDGSLWLKLPEVKV